MTAKKPRHAWGVAVMPDREQECSNCGCFRKPFRHLPSAFLYKERAGTEVWMQWLSPRMPPCKIKEGK